MKHVVWPTLTLLAGLVIGAWAPRSELTLAKQQVERLEDLLASRRGTGADGLDQVSRMLSLPTTAPADAGSAVPAATNTTATGNSPEPGTVTNRPGPIRTRRGPASSGPEDLQARIDEAVELWRVRSDIARSTFVSNAGLARDDAAQFDVLVEAMNIRLRAGFARWAEALAH
jgi:hypothetical protein